MKKPYRTRFAKWQVITLEERSKLISLILGLSIATIAFVFNLIFSSNIKPEYIFAKISVLVGMLSLLFSIYYALRTAHNRMHGFKLTTDKLKLRINEAPTSDIETAERESNKHDKSTLELLDNMLVTFGFGEIVLMGWLCLRFLMEIVK